VKELQNKKRLLKLLIFPIDEGRDPMKLLLLSMKSVRFCSLSRLDESSPSKLLSESIFFTFRINDLVLGFHETTCSLHQRFPQES